MINGFNPDPGKAVPLQQLQPDKTLAGVLDDVRGQFGHHRSDDPSFFRRKISKQALTEYLCHDRRDVATPLDFELEDRR